MKKIILLLASALAGMAIAPQAFAIPGYARQTGMECNACHFQSYPALNQFGRTFKAGGYTIIGAQLKIEGAAGLSLPATLNASVVTKIRYQKSNGPASVAGAPTGTNDGQLQFPDEFHRIRLVAGVGTWDSTDAYQGIEEGAERGRGSRGYASTGMPPITVLKPLST